MTTNPSVQYRIKQTPKIMFKAHEVRSQELSVVLDQFKADVNSYQEYPVGASTKKLNAVKAAIAKLEKALLKQRKN